MISSIAISKERGNDSTDNEVRVESDGGEATIVALLPTIHRCVRGEVCFHKRGSNDVLCVICALLGKTIVQFKISGLARQISHACLNEQVLLPEQDVTVVFEPLSSTSETISVNVVDDEDNIDEEEVDTKILNQRMVRMIK